MKSLKGGDIQKVYQAKTYQNKSVNYLVYVRRVYENV